MPLVRDPVNVNVLVDWRGDELTQRIRRGIRAGMVAQARGAVLFARELVNKDTLALHDAITFTFGRAEGGRYTLAFGVFDDPGNRPRITEGGDFSAVTGGGTIASGTERVEYPQDYAFWQEILPPPHGNAYIQPAVDTFFSERNLYLAIAGNIFYQRAGYGADPVVDFGDETSVSGLDQPRYKVIGE